MVEHYQDDPDVAIVAVQTVFEGFETNTADKLAPTARQYGLEIPFGHDPGPDGQRSSVLKGYQTGGTPWVIVMDPAGVVRFNDFHLEPEKAIELIDRLAGQHRTGSALYGQAFPDLEGADWLRGEAGDDGFPQSYLTIVRWWTDRSDPQMEDLEAVAKVYRKYRSKRVGMIAVYAPTGEPVERKELLSAARGARFTGPVIQDAEGKLRKALEEAGLPAEAALPTFLVDHAGVIRWVYLGERIGKVEGDEKAEAALEELTEQIQESLQKVRRR